MHQRRVVIAVSGGIAAYKIPELVRILHRAGHAVRCALTREARHFVSPLVLETLSGHPAPYGLFAASSRGVIDHIALADWAELVIVAPATANLLAKMTHGVADDLVTTLLLATRAPVLAAPAMNVNMWNHPATQENLATLRRRGIRFIGPEAGELACGWEGEGRMAEPVAIADAGELVLGTRTLSAERILVTAGGTREPIDPVRALTNRSSGKMGFAIAGEAARRGAEVVLVAGPCALPSPAGVHRVDVETALAMREAVHEHLPPATMVVMSAAVGDFRPAAAAPRKLRKEDLRSDAGMTLELIRNPDILSEVCAQKGSRLVVGFAAETHEVIESARRKLARKGCDLVVANDVSGGDAGFESDENVVSFIWPSGSVEELPRLPKREIAAQLLDRLEKLREGRR